MSKRNIEYALAKVLSLVNHFIPKDKRLMVFYDTSESLCDNTEAIYSYINKNDKSNNYKKIVLLPNVEKKHSRIHCALKFMRAKYVFYSYGDTKIVPTKKQVVVNQWHGSPLKTIGKLTKDASFKKEKLDNFTYILASSELFRKPLANAFGCDESKVIVAGQARNDYLFEKEQSEFFKEELHGNKYNKTIIWMPTFRVSKDRRFVDNASINTETMLPIFGSFEELKKLDVYLKKKKILIVIKVHHYADFKAASFSNIKYVTNEDLCKNNTKLYSFVKDFDSLITDYSSIFPDYCLLDKPMGFTVDDYETYGKERGFSIDNPIQYMAGNHIYDSKDFYMYIDEIYSDEDHYSEDRKRVKRIMNRFEDGNCERLCNLIKIDLNKGEKNEKNINIRNI